MVEERVPAGFVVQSNVVEGEDDWSVTLGNPLHRTVDSSMRSLHIMLLDNELLHSLSQARQFPVNQQGFGLNDLDVIHFKELQSLWV